MIDQLSMFDTAAEPMGRVGHNHPDTSWAAAYASAHANRGHRGRILLALLDVGDQGMTAGEVGLLLGVSTNIAGSRMIELRAEGCAAGEFRRLAQRTPERRSIPGGRPGYVHVLTEDGRAVAHELRGRIDGHSDAVA